MDRYLASKEHGGTSGKAGRWFCATKFLGSTTHGSRVSAYAWALCEETKTTGNRVVLGSGDSVPVVVYLRSSNSGFQPVGYDEPGDAPAYEPDIRKLFPSNVADWILGSAHQGDLKLLQASVVNQARAASS